MITHPLWRPFEQPTDEEIAAARVVPAPPAPIEIASPDSTWPAAFEQLRDLLVHALGDRALAVEHVGSTAVPGLPAKAVIDVDLVVADSADEPSWLPDLERAGLELAGREPAWEEHRILRRGTRAGFSALGGPLPANVHVWSPGARELARHRAFRDWLRTHPDDLATYAAAKQAAAARGFTDAMHYNNAKGGVVYDLYERIFAADPDHPHDPQPRA